MCHRASDATAWRCGCSYEIGQPVEVVRGLLEAQHSSAWIALLLLLAVDVAATAGVVYAALHGFIVFSALGFTALTLMTGRTARKVLITRDTLRRLAERHPPLPKAVIHRHTHRHTHTR
jgi:hypothetical protein